VKSKHVVGTGLAGAIAAAGAVAFLPAGSANAASTSTIVVSASQGQIITGSVSTLTATLTSGSSDLSGERVTLQQRAPGAETFTSLLSGTTDSSGVATFSVAPKADTQYRIVFSGDGSNLAATSGTVTVDVAPAVAISASDTAITSGDNSVISTVATYAKGETVYLQRRTAAGIWVTIGHTTLSSSTGKASFSVSPTATSTYRTVVSATAAHTQGRSKALTVSVS
jgi:hypothetical protein